MKTPFTVEQFLEVFRNYNETVFPMQVIFYLISVLAIYLAVKPTSKSDNYKINTKWKYNKITIYSTGSSETAINKY